MPVDRHLAHLRAPDIASCLGERSLIVQPLGAIEQHGAHLPFNTDLLVAERVATAAVERVGDEVDAWLLPPLAYTKSNEHAWSPGTVWLSASTLLAVLDDLGRCVAMTPARRLVFLNGHGGNSALVNVANRELRLHHGLMTFLAHPGLPPDQGGSSPAGELGMGIHGGTDETSLMLHLAPDLVDMAAAARRVPEHLAGNRYVRFGGPVSFGWLSDDFGDEGVIGDPLPATAARRRAVRGLGRRVLRRAARDRVVRIPAMTGRRWDELRVDGPRLWARIVELGEIGAIKGPNGEEGCARLALTDADRAGRDLVVGWMRDLGLDVAIDAIGNVIATRPGTDPDAAPVMTGSHIDTVATGGRFDGNLGVLAGLEVVETLAQHGVMTRRPISVAFFSDEEGSRFPPDMLGSLVFVGGLAVEAALDIRAVDDGARVGDEVARIGYAGPLPCPTARRPTPTSSCTSSRVRSSRTRGSRSASSRACRASRGPS